MVAGAKARSAWCPAASVYASGREGPYTRCPAADGHGPEGSENVMPGGMSECSHWPMACECAEPGGGAHG